MKSLPGLDVIKFGQLNPKLLENGQNSKEF